MLVGCLILDFLTLHYPLSCKHASRGCEPGLARLQAVAEMAAERGVPLWFEPVSVPKAVRATGALHRLHYVSPNAEELVAMAGAVRSVSGMPPLPEPGLATTSDAGDRNGEGQPRLPEASGSGRGCDDAVAEVRRRVGELAPHLCTVLGAGVRNVVLTLGCLGAAWCTLRSEALIPQA